MNRIAKFALGAAMMAVALTAGAQAAGNLASQPTYLETKINGPDKSWTGNDFQLEVGKYYIWEITSDGIEETLVQAPELFRNAWFNQVVINDKEVHSSGAYYGVEYDGAGTIAISFVPLRPGDYDFYAPGYDNLKGTFHAVQAAQKHMVEQRSGKMVLISSTSALGNRGQTNYATAKAGLQGMAKTLAIELGPFNVNVNCVAPGFIETAMTKQTAERVGMDFDAFKKAAAESIPLRRVGQPEDVAATIAFLCSEDAGFVSGHVIYVAGGPRA